MEAPLGNTTADDGSRSRRTPQFEEFVGALGKIGIRQWKWTRFFGRTDKEGLALGDVRLIFFVHIKDYRVQYLRSETRVVEATGCEHKIIRVGRASQKIYYASPDNHPNNYKLHMQIFPIWRIGPRFRETRKGTCVSCLPAGCVTSMGSMWLSCEASWHGGGSL